VNGTKNIVRLKRFIEEGGGNLNRKLTRMFFVPATDENNGQVCAVLLGSPIQFEAVDLGI
jgi:hypothetical protein